VLGDLLESDDQPESPDSGPPSGGPQ